MKLCKALERVLEKEGIAGRKSRLRVGLVKVMTGWLALTLDVYGCRFFHCVYEAKTFTFDFV